MISMNPIESTDDGNSGQSDVAPWIMVISVFLMFLVPALVIFLG